MIIIDSSSLNLIKALAETVMAMRNRYPRWPVPDRSDSALFCVTEAAEVIDALLRRKPVYLRNNQKQPNLGRELAQTVMMAVLAVHGQPFPNWPLVRRGPHSPQLGLIRSAAELAERRDVRSACWVIYYALLVARYHNVDLIHEVANLNAPEAAR